MDSYALVIFGITSNLAQIKLIPALYDMVENNSLPKKIKIFGVSRKDWNSEKLKGYFKEVLNKENRHHKHLIAPKVLKELVSKIEFLSGQLEDEKFYFELKKKVANFNKKIFYLATYPELYEVIFNNFKKADLNGQGSGFVRLIIEKPIGVDLSSAKKLNKLLDRFFSENQIFRLDHYLGKETLQNILSFRFGNDIFEPLINGKFVDHIQITALENFGIADRGGYYDLVGALKDVGQNHMLQMVVLATMNAPALFNNEEITKERIKVLKNLIPDPEKIIFGQYKGYLKEKSVAKNSKIDTFFALRTYLNNERFKGVPIYLRAGKALAKTETQISIIFKTPVNRLVKHLKFGEEPNVLTYKVTPQEGVSFKILTKRPKSTYELAPNLLEFNYQANESSHTLQDPYERLLLDAIRGDQTFFNHKEEVEAAWRFVEPLTKVKEKVIIYPQGSLGPREADKLIMVDGRFWIN